MHYMLFYFQGKYNPTLADNYRFRSDRVFGEPVRKTFQSEAGQPEVKNFPF